MSTRIIRKPEVLGRICVSDVTLWRWERKKKFPARIQLGANSVGWIESEVEEWIAKRIEARR